MTSSSNHLLLYDAVQKDHDPPLCRNVKTRARAWNGAGSLEMVMRINLPTPSCGSDLPTPSCGSDLPVRNFIGYIEDKIE